MYTGPDDRPIIKIVLTALLAAARHTHGIIVSRQTTQTITQSRELNITPIRVKDIIH